MFAFFVFFQALCGNSGYLKCISDMDLSLANKNLLPCIHFLYSRKKMSPNNDILLKELLISNWLNGSLGSCAL